MTLFGKKPFNRKRLFKTCFQAKSKKNVWFNIISNWILTNPVVFISFRHVNSCIFDSFHGFVHMPFFTKFVWHYWVRTFDRVISWFLPVCYPPCYCLEGIKNCSLDFDFALNKLKILPSVGFLSVNLREQRPTWFSSTSLLQRKSLSYVQFSI